MPDVITSIVPEPRIFHSGGSTTLTISYQSIAPGPLELRTSAPFTISHTSIALAPDPAGVARVAVTIRRVTPSVGPARCDVVATFCESSLHFFVEVT